MWSNGIREDFVLPPKHAALFSAALAVLSDNVGWERWEEDWDGSNPPFVRLTQGQRQAALLQIARALLTASEPPTVTAVLAAAVAEVYDTLRVMLELEIGEGAADTEVRRLVLAAVHEADYWNTVNDALTPDEDLAVPPAEDSADADEWDELVHALETDILEDFDFEMEDRFLDCDPEESAALKRQLNIDPAYFTDVPEDPPRDRFPEVRRELHALLRVHGP